MRVIFAGSPAVAVPYLHAVIEAGFDVRAVITREPAPLGRKRVVTQTPVHDAAVELGLPVIAANSLRDIDVPAVDLGVVVAYGGLVPPELLAQPTHGWINVHFSVLPAYRGAAPVQRALWDGNDNSGVSIFRLVDELDAGPVFASRSIPFTETESASEALDRMSRETVDDLVGTMRRIEAGVAEPREQSGEVSFAPKFVREDGRIDWANSATTIVHRIRAVTDEPGAFTTLHGVTFGVIRAFVTSDKGLPPGSVEVASDGVFVGTGVGSVGLDVVKPSGKNVMSAVDWARGIREAVVFE